MKKKKEIKYLKAIVKELQKDLDAARVEREMFDEANFQVDKLKECNKKLGSLVREADKENFRLNQLIQKHGNLIKDNYEDVEVGQYYLCLSDVNELSSEGTVVKIHFIGINEIQLDNGSYLAFLSRKHFKRVTITEE